MIIITKLILITLLVISILIYFIKVKSKRLDKIIFLLLLLTGIVFIIQPDITNRIAHILGIGRGADLIFYLAIIFFFFALILLYSKNKDLEKKLNDLVRSDALDKIND
jgi:hypothetical protein